MTSFFQKLSNFFSAIHSKNYILYHYTHIHRNRNRKIHKIVIILIVPSNTHFYTGKYTGKRLEL